MKTFYILLLSILLLTSCGKTLPSHGEFKIVDLEYNGRFCKYHLSSLNGIGDFWMYGELKDYNLGDTLKITK